MNIVSWIKKYSIPSKNARNSLEKTLKAFSGCNQAQSELALVASMTLMEICSNPLCIECAREKHSYDPDPSQPTFTLHPRTITFNHPKRKNVKIRIRLARSSTPGCSKNDPVVSVEKNGFYKLFRPLSQIEDLIEEIDSILESETADKIKSLISSVTRSSIDETTMSFQERAQLLPAFTSIASNWDQNLETELVLYDFGRVDVAFYKNGNRIYAELKFVRASENPLSKLRIALGQILTYHLSQTPSDEAWVVLNRKLDDSILETIISCYRRAKVKLFYIDMENNDGGRNLVPIA